MMKPQVVFVLGGPGAGKGTQCARIVEVGGRTMKITILYTLWLKRHTRYLNDELLFLLFSQASIQRG